MNYVMVDQPNQTDGGKPPLRVGVLVDSLSPQAWQHEIIEEVRNAPYATLCAVIRNVGKPERGSVLSRMWSRRQHFLYSLYRKVDARIFRAGKSAFKPTSIEPLPDGCVLLDVEPRRTKFCDYFQDEDVDHILSLNLDVVLRFGFRILKGRSLTIAKYGVWSYHHADNLVRRGSPAGFWEVVDNIPITGTILQVLTEDLDAGDILYRSFTRTDPKSVARHCNRYFWRSTAFVPRVLQRLHEDGPAALQQDPLRDIYKPYDRPLYHAPGNLAMLSIGTRLAGRFMGDAIRNTFKFEQWFLTYQFRQTEAITEPSLRKFIWLTSPKDRFWADPFAIERDGRYFVFFEELLYSTNKGHLCVMELSPQGIVGTPQRILEKDYHLSYPFLLAHDNKLFMIPESSQAKRVDMFECVEFPHRWEYRQTLLPDTHGTDATLFFHNDRWWMFVVIERPGIPPDTELFLFYADTPYGPWKPCKNNPVKSDVRNSRPAGNLFHYHGRLLRPAQNGAGIYGYGIAFNEVTRLDEHGLEERVVWNIEPSWAPNLVGTHTLNFAGKLTVSDARRTRWRF